jgi:hypothetical protein
MIFNLNCIRELGTQTFFCKYIPSISAVMDVPFYYGDNDYCLFVNWSVGTIEKQKSQYPDHTTCEAGYTTETLEVGALIYVEKSGSVIAYNAELFINVNGTIGSRQPINYNSGPIATSSGYCNSGFSPATTIVRRYLWIDNGGTITIS